jgi:hypothetical protein
MKNKLQKTSITDIEYLKEYLERGGVTVTIDTNPSPEKIAEIRASIARNEELQEEARIRFKNK